MAQRNFFPVALKTALVASKLGPERAGKQRPCDPAAAATLLQTAHPHLSLATPRLKPRVSFLYSPTAVGGEEAGEMRCGISLTRVITEIVILFAAFVFFQANQPVPSRVSR